jgi:hypothetical protein
VNQLEEAIHRLKEIASGPNAQEQLATLSDDEIRTMVGFCIAGTKEITSEFKEMIDGEYERRTPRLAREADEQSARSLTHVSEFLGRFTNWGLLALKFAFVPEDDESEQDFSAAVNHEMRNRGFITKDETLRLTDLDEHELIWTIARVSEAQRQLTVLIDEATDKLTTFIEKTGKEPERGKP